MPRDNKYDMKFTSVAKVNERINKIENRQIYNITCLSRVFFSNINTRILSILKIIDKIKKNATRVLEISKIKTLKLLSIEILTLMIRRNENTPKSP
jgi:hypothetical protein